MKGGINTPRIILSEPPPPPPVDSRLLHLELEVRGDPWALGRRFPIPESSSVRISNPA